MCAYCEGVKDQANSSKKKKWKKEGYANSACLLAARTKHDLITSTADDNNETEKMQHTEC